MAAGIWSWAHGSLCPAAAMPQELPKSGLVYAEGEHLMLDGRPYVMKGYCYLPRDYAWTALCDWDWEEVDTELALAREYGANTIRTGFDYTYTTGDLYLEHPFTKYNFTPENLQAIEKLLQLADKHGLKVVLYIGGGPWGIGWDPANYWLIEKRLQAMIPLFAGDPRIAAWDLCTDVDGNLLLPPSPSGGGAYGVDPRANRENLVTLLSNMATTIRTLDPDHLITVGFCWPSSSLLAQDFTDFLMPQFLGGDAPNILVADQAAQIEGYVDGFWEYAADPEKGVEILADKILSLKRGLHRPRPIVLAEYGFPSRGPDPIYSEGTQKIVYEAVLETAFIELEIAGALNWVLTDFNWPPKARTAAWPEGLTETEASFGILDTNYQPKPAAEVARAYYADRPEITLSTAPRYIDFVFSHSFTPPETDPTSSDFRVLCAAFDWLEFQDSTGKTLLRLDIGSDTARSYLRQGFYADEGPWGNEADNFAWAGNDEKRARVEVQLPEGAANIVFRATSNLRQRVEVKVDGESAGTVHLDTGWHRCQVRIPRSEYPAVGRSCTVHGVMNLPLSKATVTVESSHDGRTWTPVGQVSPQRGRFEATVSFQHAGRTLVRARWSGAGYYASATSEPYVIQVRPTATEIELSVTSQRAGAELSAGDQAVLSGHLEPPCAELPVSLAVTAPSGTLLTASTTTDQEGHFQTVITVNEGGSWTARAVWAGNSDRLPSETTCSFEVATHRPLFVPLGVGLGAAVVVAAAAGGAVLLRRRRRRRPA